MPEPWVVKYRPKTRVAIVGNSSAVAQVAEWVRSWDNGVPKKRALLLYGPPGVGKTVTVEALVRELGYDLVEINASDERNREKLERIVGAASQQGQLVGKKRMILLDEIDGINLSEDRGAIDAVVRVIGDSQVPIVLTANDAWEPKISRLRTACQMVQYKRLGIRELVPFLRKVLQSEGHTAEEAVLRLVIDRNNGDLRGILNDLQTLLAGRRQLGLVEAEWLGYRDRKDSIFDALATVFNSKEAWRARRVVDEADVDYQMLFEWVYENAPRQLSHPIDMAKAMQALAKADLYMARIRRTQNWSLLPFFFNHMTAGVALARAKTKPGWVPNKFPSRIQNMGRTRKFRAVRNQVASAIATQSHISSKRAVREYLPYIRLILELNPGVRDQFAEWLGLEEEALAFLGAKKSSGVEDE